MAGRDVAGLPACTSHGPRKLCLTRLAEVGCTVFEIMSISGHKNVEEVQKYVDAANQRSWRWRPWANYRPGNWPMHEQKSQTLTGRFGNRAKKVRNSHANFET